MRVATWNVNNVVRRLDLLLDWLARTQPDVVALQELKRQSWEIMVVATSAWPETSGH
ncbi:endonuclease/exonuclease/phosphatase family protein [Roseateles sp. P5_E8]